MTWVKGFRACRPEPFQPGGEGAATERLFDFVRRADDYGETRDFLAPESTSVLSADLRFGTLAPRTVVNAVGTSTAGRAAFVRQLAWRDWYTHLLWELPSLVDRSMRPEFGRIEWENDPADITAWQEGRTGYPYIDAGMRQLATTGWMHNRVRMATASFLVKDLLVDWRIGERWFRRLLVDADIARTRATGSGWPGPVPTPSRISVSSIPSSSPRNSIPDGAYIRRFVPELAHITTPWIHRPWTAPPEGTGGGRSRSGCDLPVPDR